MFPGFIQILSKKLDKMTRHDERNSFFQLYVDFLKRDELSFKTYGDVDGGVDHQIDHLQIRPQIQTEVIFYFV